MAISVNTFLKRPESLRSAMMGGLSIFWRSDIGLLYCHHVSTDWKAKPRRRGLTSALERWMDMELHHEPRTRDLLDRAFSQQSAGDGLK